MVKWTCITLPRFMLLHYIYFIYNTLFNLLSQQQCPLCLHKFKHHFWGKICGGHNHVPPEQNWINTFGLVALVVTGMPTNWCIGSHFTNRKKIWRHVNTSTFLKYSTSSTFSVKVTMNNLSLFLSDYRSNISLLLCCYCLFTLNQAVLT